MEFFHFFAEIGSFFFVVIYALFLTVFLEWALKKLLIIRPKPSDISSSRIGYLFLFSVTLLMQILLIMCAAAPLVFFSFLVRHSDLIIFDYVGFCLLSAFTIFMILFTWFKPTHARIMNSV